MISGKINYTFMHSNTTPPGGKEESPYARTWRARAPFFFKYCHLLIFFWREIQIGRAGRSSLTLSKFVYFLGGETLYQRQKILLVDLTFKNGLGLKENNRQLFNKIHFYTCAIFFFFRETCRKEFLCTVWCYYVVCIII